MQSTKRRAINPLLTGSLICALSGAAAPFALASPDDAVREDVPTDREIGEAIDQELRTDPSVMSFEVDVSCVSGIVTLAGRVNNVMAKDRAGEIAETLRGVRAVINRLEVEPKPRPSAEIEADVEDALLFDSATDSYEIDPAVEGSVVTLRGEVSSFAEKLLAVRVAKGVRGVTAVEDELVVDYGESRSNAEIMAEIDRRMAWNVYLDDSLITVDVKGKGEVVLTGHVGSAAEKRRARSLSYVAGVTKVDASDLNVSEWRRDERFRKDKYVLRKDGELEDAVEDAFLFDPRVMSFEIDAEAESGTVTLRGEVDNLKSRRAAANVARHTVGVWAVKNLIKVDSENRPSDSRIESRIEKALARDPYVSSYEIRVSVDGGVATLRGEVDTVFEKTSADDIASKVAGVLEVNNRLKVERLMHLVYEPYVSYDLYPYTHTWYRFQHAPAPMDDAALQSAVRNELWWSPFVDEDEVEITVQGGTVTLRGTVDTFAERRAAQENAFEAGAVIVANELVVEFGPKSLTGK